MQAITAPANRAERRALEKAARGRSKPRSNHSTRSSNTVTDLALMAQHALSGWPTPRINGQGDTNRAENRTGKRHAGDDCAPTATPSSLRKRQRLLKQ